MTTEPYVIQSGDTLVKIAARNQMSSWRELYYHPDNADFRKKRPNPDRIFPGDIINVPAIGSTISCDLPPKKSKYTVVKDTMPALIDARYGHDGSFEKWLQHVYAANEASFTIGLGVINPILFFEGETTLTTLLFRLEESVVPKWFAVALSPSLDDFSNPNIFFHPNPRIAHMDDSNYGAKSGNWKRLFRYAQTCGRQLAFSERKQVFIMPYLTSTIGLPSGHCGILAADWKDLITDILVKTKAIVRPDDGSDVEIQSVITSSYSFGIQYSDTFRKSATDINRFLREIWDFDGLYTTAARFSRALVGMSPRFKVIQFDQDAKPPVPTALHAPFKRWSLYPWKERPINTPDKVHDVMPGVCFYSACKLSSVG